MLHQDKWQFSCHQIWCELTLIVYSAAKWKTSNIRRFGASRTQFAKYSVAGGLNTVNNSKHFARILFSRIASIFIFATFKIPNWSMVYPFHKMAVCFHHFARVLFSQNFAALVKLFSEFTILERPFIYILSTFWFASEVSLRICEGSLHARIQRVDRGFGPPGKSQNIGFLSKLVRIA